jgi:hypothetical protein
MTAALPCFTVLSIGCIACAFTGIGATNATLALPGNEEYQETGLFVSETPTQPPTTPSLARREGRLLTTRCGRLVVLHI